MDCVSDANRCVLWGGMIRKISADQITVPRPVVFRIARGMNAHETIACANESLKGGLLRSIQDISSCGKKNDALVLS